MERERGWRGRGWERERMHIPDDCLASKADQTKLNPASREKTAKHTSVGPAREPYRYRTSKTRQEEGREGTACEVEDAEEEERGRERGERGREADVFSALT